MRGAGQAVFWAILTSFGFSSCGFVETPGGRGLNANAERKEEEEELEESEAVFFRTLFPLVREYCGDCHNELGGQAPFFAFHHEIKRSHDAVLDSQRQLVRLENPSQSRLVTKARSNHGSWTGDWEADALELQEAIEQWAYDLRIEEEVEPEVIRGTNRVDVPLPSNLSSCSNPINQWNWISFSLNGLVEGLVGAQARLRICKFSGQSYRIAGLEIQSPVSLELSGVRVYLNEVARSVAYLNFLTNRTVQASSSFLSVNLGVDTQGFLPIENLAPNQDKIHLDFDSLRVISIE